MGDRNIPRSHGENMTPKQWKIIVTAVLTAALAGAGVYTGTIPIGAALQVASESFSEIVDTIAE